MPDINTINAVEKRELAKIIQTEFDVIINNLKQEIKYTEGEILEEAEKKFGLQYIDKEIMQLRSKIDMLEKQKTDLGFNRHGNGFVTTWKDNNSIVDPRTKAGRFYYMKIARNVDISALEKQKNDRLKTLWLLNDRKEVQKLATDEVKLIEIPKQKVKAIK